MLHRYSLVLAVVARGPSAMSASVNASTVLLSNLDQQPQASNAVAFVGQSFIAGTVDEPLYGARMHTGCVRASSQGIILEVEARNSDGTVGATLFSDFSSSFDATTNEVTFTANSSFELKAGTGYWLVLSDPSAGGVNWDYTASNTYQSQFGYGLPSYNTSWSSTADNGQGDLPVLPAVERSPALPIDRIRPHNGPRAVLVAPPWLSSCDRRSHASVPGRPDCGGK